ncbi:MAG: transglycosylase SLT domain-containing protein [Acidihalobacter sp.]|uniref:transglycosylase SLT domain-containing protein n=1 Tax=Acidihalobacter sp. TaxID=1872108 RepID=UPI00307FB057
MRAALFQRFGACLRLATLVLVSVLSAQAQASTPAQQAAERFQNALSALNNGDMSRYRALAGTLQDYILQPYLQFAYLQTSLKSASTKEIDDFLHRNRDLPIAAELHRAWLLELARRKEWKQFLATDAPAYNDTLVACARTSALKATGRGKEATELARRLWLVGYEQPSSCDPAFDLLRRNGHVPANLVRARLLLALQAGNPRLGRYLVTLLPADQQPVARRWLRVYGSPAELQRVELPELGDRDAAAQVITAALRRLGRKQPADAHALWAGLEARLKTHLSDTQRRRIARTIAIFAAIDGLPQGERWLNELPPATASQASREWRARAALRTGNWSGLLTAIRAMPRYQRDKDAWRYWEARALLQTGKIAAARRLADPLAREFSYYGFLAADLIQRPYAQGPQPQAKDPALQKRVGGMYLTRIALALHQAGQTTDAGAVWRELLRRLTPRERLAAARLAHRQQWAYAAYTAAAQSPARGASALTFPLAHWTAVRLAARSNNLSPDLVLSLMRQESAFQSSVCSSAGACGLMQLMPRTACWIGKHSDLGKHLCDRHRLSEPGVSIRAGSAYLSYLMGRFANDVVAAVAAYNAGPTNVSQWLANSSLRMDTPRWVATLPFGETRRYIQAVLFNRVVYAQRSKQVAQTANRELTLRLSDLLGSVSQSPPG